MDTSNIGIDVSVLVDKLNVLETPNEVADFLRTQDIQGEKGRASSCVISNWIKRESGGAYVTTAARVKIWYSELGARLHSEMPLEEHTVSLATLDFIQLFDRGDYPDLVG